MKNYRIGILGIGGVGGYLGGKLAAAKLPDAEIIFIARNETKATLKQSGLKLITDQSEEIAVAQLVSDDPAEIGLLDLLICAVKGYDLADSLQRYAACLGKGSVVMPMLNGIGVADRVRAKLPEAQVWESCIYIVARREAWGVIRQSGPVNQLYFGSPTAADEDLKKLETLFKRADLKADIVPDIETELWKKFFFISVMATFTSYYNAAIGLAQKQPEKAAEIRLLLDELAAVAQAKAINLPAGIVDGTYDRILSLPPETTSSMYADFQKKGPTELEQLTGEVVQLGKQFGVATTLYNKMYEGLLNRINQ
ncbi:MAG: 2-dehydropantoate 2-reductase [Bacteroidota bacterium]|nr:2-dehydropantoate 2-reductase [Bacteroidota bacterium]